MRMIPLVNGGYTQVDDADYVFLSQWEWSKNEKNYVIRTAMVGPSGNRRSIIILMHRALNQTPNGFDTDHDDGNPLNNQKHNLRIATRSQNAGNSKKRKGKTSSKYKGVTWNTRTNRWLVRVTCQKTTHYLGTFKRRDEKLAAAAYNRGALEFFGEFARINAIY